MLAIVLSLCQKAKDPKALLWYQIVTSQLCRKSAWLQFIHTLGFPRFYSEWAVNVFRRCVSFLWDCDLAGAINVFQLVTVKVDNEFTLTSLLWLDLEGCYECTTGLHITEMYRHFSFQWKRNHNRNGKV